MIPDAGKGKQPIVLHSEVERLFLSAASPPFEKPVRGKQAPAAHEGFSEGGVSRDRFSAGVDRLVSDAGVRGPGWNQAQRASEKCRFGLDGSGRMIPTGRDGAML